MRIADKKALEIRENNLYLEDRELLDFIPRIKEIKKDLTFMGNQVSYKIQIIKNGKVIQTD